MPMDIMVGYSARYLIIVQKPLSFQLLFFKGGRIFRIRAGANNVRRSFP